VAGKFEYGLRIGENRAYAEGRARAFGIGPPNPHAQTSLKYAAFQAGLNFTGSRDSTPYGQAGWQAVWTPVTFDGTNDILRNTTDLGLPSTFDTFTLATAFKLNEAKSQSLINGVVSGGAVNLSLSAGGVMTLAAFNPGVWGFVAGAVSSHTFLPGIYYIVHFAARASTNTLQVWVNGSAGSITGATWFGTAPFGRPTTWEIGGGNATPSLSADVGLVWFDRDQYITTPTAFAPAYDLGPQLAAPGAQPAIGFGGSQTAADWNAGTNLGYGTGSWTMTGAVT
jgi:hypothetical protein